MKIKLVIPIFIILLSSCTKDNLNEADNLKLKDIDDSEIVAVWINPQQTEEIITYTKSESLIENQYGISFKSDGELIERKNSGFCGTPPISYGDFEGTWSKTDSIVDIEVDFWGGITSYRWKIIEISEETLKIELLESNYNP